MDDVKERLAEFGYTVMPEDETLIGFIIVKVENHIKNQCNILAVSEGLHEIAVDMAVGEFLLFKKASGQLTGFDLDSAAKSIQEGDTSITFADGTPEKRLDSLISYLVNHGDGAMASFRRVRW